MATWAIYRWIAGTRGCTVHMGSEIEIGMVEKAFGGGHWNGSIEFGLKE